MDTSQPIKIPRRPAMSFLSFCSLENSGVACGGGVGDVSGVDDSSDMVIVDYQNSFILASSKPT